MTSKGGNNGNRQRKISHSDDRIFEHPEVTIKPTTIDDRIQRRIMTSTQPFNTHLNGGGSVPNILEHPDMRTPIVRDTQSPTLSSSSTSSSSDKRKLVRQQSGRQITQTSSIKPNRLLVADVYSTLVRTASPTNQTHLGMEENEREKQTSICMFSIQTNSIELTRIVDRRYYRKS